MYKISLTALISSFTLLLTSCGETNNTTANDSSLSSPSVTPSNTPTYLPTDTPSATPSVTPSNTPTHLPTDISSATPSVTPSNTPTASITPTPSQDVWASDIYPNIVQSNCMNCHTLGSGNPAGNTAYAFTSNENTGHLETNRQTFSDYATSRKTQTLLDKPRGFVNHSGGVPLADGSDDYLRFETYVLSLSANTTTPTSSLNTPIPTASTSPSVTPTSIPSVVPVNEVIGFSTHIYPQIIEAKCMGCHTPEGLAQNSSLIFSGSNAAANQPLFDLYISHDTQLAILNKVQGIGHGGGVQLTQGSEHFQWLSDYAYGLRGEQQQNAEAELFFKGVVFESSKETFKRAYLLLTGGYPDAALLTQADNASDETLHQMLVDSMQGQGFHNFLIRGANDQLLIDKMIADGDTDDGFEQAFVEFSEREYQRKNDLIDNDTWVAYRNAIRLGVARAPVELIAHVVENDLPYSEILTANYTMMNKTLAGMYGADISFANDEAFKPGQIKHYLRESHNATFSGNSQTGYQYDGTGLETNLPLAGLLSDHGFMKRYPSTATNRNRARARWVYYYFLGHDIEKSAMRSTDQETLADTDNPTLNNPACTVCHLTMDPVAGAFQNWGDDGFYRDQVKGLDSLPGSYRFIPNPDKPGKNMVNPHYHAGITTWYHDMLEAGFENKIAPDNTNSLQWLATEIVNDERFYQSAVKFWWPAVFGRNYQNAPNDESDVTYTQELARFQQQSSFSGVVANNFKQHKNLKHMLADLVMSRFYRAQSGDQTASENMNLLTIGTERLLTPEELANKTESLTGFVWNNKWDPTSTEVYNSDFRNAQRINLGGIDSDDVITRGRDMSAFMTGIAMRHALEASCPLVAYEFNQASAERKLFPLLEQDLLPGLITRQIIETTGTHHSDQTQHSLDINSSDHQLRLFIRDHNYLSDDNGKRRVALQSVKVFDQANKEVALIYPGLIKADASNNFIARSIATPYSSVTKSNSSVRMNSATSGFSFTLDLPSAGSYRLEFSLYGEQYGDELAAIDIAVLNADFSADSSNAIHETITHLYELLLDQPINDIELNAAYDVFTQAWLNKLYRSPFNSMSSNGATCTTIPNQDGLRDDYHSTKSAWRALLVYLMIDYRYMHQ